MVARLIAVMLVLVSLVLILPTASHASEFDKKCSNDFPEWHQFFERRSCISRLENTKREEEHKKNREEIARPCISKDLARMEAVAQKIKDGIKEDMTFEKATEKLEEILEKKVFTRPTKSDSKKWVAIANIPTTCQSAFHFLVKINAYPGKKVLRLGIWSMSAPKGYRNGHMSEFSTNFARPTRERANLKRRQENLKKSMREAERRKKIFGKTEK